MVGIIGDIHGCYYTLKKLVKSIREKYPDIQLYCVGDLVDRGNFSCEVVDYIISENIKFTPGNHDYMFYYFMKHPSSLLGASWIYNGYESTLESYEDRYEKMENHLNFIKEAPLYYNLDDCFISHAGISISLRKRLAEIPLSDIGKLDDAINSSLESEEGILWTRNDLLDLTKLQVVGHTRMYDIRYISANNTVYIDTSAYAGNKLTGIIVDNSEIIEAVSIETFDEDLHENYS